MVRNQVLATDTHIQGIPVLEVTTHALQGRLGDLGLLQDLVGQLPPAEDVVPDLVNHLLGSNLALALRPPEEVSVQPWDNRVVAHVDRGVTQGLDKESRVEGQLRAQTVSSRACPLVQPVQNADEGILGLGRVGVQVVLDPVNGLVPPLVLTVVDVPLVHQSHNTLEKGVC